MLKAVLDLVIPHRCFGCDELSEGPVCNNCLDALTLIDGNHCQKCGKPTEEPVERCRECKGKRIHFNRARSLFTYEGVAENIIKGFKYEGGRLIPGELLKAICREGHETHPGGFKTRPYIMECDMITFIPSGVMKYLKRGYNPAEEIAKAIYKDTGKMYSRTMIFRRPISDQTTLDKSERSKNLKGAFKVVGANNHLPILKGKKIILVDDVYTTGATVGQAALALRKAGAKEVNVFTLARRL